MKAVEITYVVTELESADRSTRPRDIAAYLGADLRDIGPVLIRARYDGLLVRRYNRELQFGRRDTYHATHRGQVAARELKSA